MSKLEKVKREIAKYDYVRFAICDLNGVSRGPIVPSRHAAKYLETGVDMYQDALMFGSETEIVYCPHKNDYSFGNMSMFPDLDTLRSIPWGGDSNVTVGEILCESIWKKDNSPQQACPRYAAKQQLGGLADRGLQLYSGFEMEYFLFYADTMKPVFDGVLFMDHRTQIRHGEVVFALDQLLIKSGVDVEKHHSEYAPGMFEAVMAPTYGIECPDSTFNLKQGLREIADMKGLRASFISKYDLNQTGCGSHFNFSVLSTETGRNVFYDANDPDNLSVTARQWIAGILKHSRALTALTSPTPNCYRRLHQPWAPSSISWGIEDREALLRVKNHGPSETYFENRLPSGLSNPYLVVAATVAAGLDGVVNKLECPPQGTLDGAEPLPKSLPEAIAALKEDKDLINTLGDELITWYIECKGVDVKKFETLTDDESMALERKIYS